MPNPLAEYFARNPGETHASLALRAGIPIDTLRSYVHGRRSISLRNALAIERATDGEVKPTSWVETAPTTKAAAGVGRR